MDSVVQVLDRDQDVIDEWLTQRAQAVSSSRNPTESTSRDTAVLWRFQGEASSHAN